MRRLIALLIILAAPVAARPQVMRSPAPAPYAVLWSFTRNNTVLATSAWGGTKLPSNRGITVVAAKVNVSIGSGGGAGTTVVRICIPNGSGVCSAGATNICSATFLCTETAALGPVEAALSGSCEFAPGSKVVADVGSSTCTTSQGSIHHFDVLVNWR